MSPVVIELRAAEDGRDVVHQAVQALVEGKLVAFPTETVYGLAASALDEAAVRRLIEAKGRRRGQPLTLAVKSADEARDFVPDMSGLAQRLARRCWPGPVTLVVDDYHPEGLLRQLPAAVQKMVVPQRTLGLRVPGHQVILDVLQMLAGPLVLSSANLTGQPEAVTAREVLEALGDRVDLVLDDGPCRFGEPSSVVRVAGNRYEILRAGVVPERTLQRLASLMILFLHGQHLPQPDGRGDFPADSGQAVGLPDRPIGGPGGAGHVGGRGRHDGGPGQPGGRPHHVDYGSGHRRP